MRRAKKHYSRPKKPFDKARIEEEKQLMKKYGLKNKKEIWKAEYEINKIRAQAKKLILEPEKQEQFFARLAKLGLIEKGATLDDVLALSKEKWLDRRLQTLVFAKGLAKTPREARQLIVHGHIMVDNRVVRYPSFIVPINLENKIKNKLSVKK